MNVPKQYPDSLSVATYQHFGTCRDSEQVVIAEFNIRMASFSCIRQRQDVGLA